MIPKSLHSTTTSMASVMKSSMANMIMSSVLIINFLAIAMMIVKLSQSKDPTGLIVSSAITIH